MEFSDAYKCCNCGEPYSIQRNDIGKIIGFMGSDGKVVTTCISCRQILQPTTIRDVKKIQANGSLTLAITRMKANTQNAQDGESLLSLGLFYLQSGGYTDAQAALQKAIDNSPECADAYFYYAISLLKGRSAFVQTKTTIDLIEENLRTAVSLANATEDNEKLCLYYYFHAYIVKNYYEKKFYRTPVSSKSLLYQANGCGLTFTDRCDLFDMLKVERPDNF